MGAGRGHSGHPEGAGSAPRPGAAETSSGTAEQAWQSRCCPRADVIPAAGRSADPQSTRAPAAGHRRVPDEEEAPVWRSAMHAAPCPCEAVIGSHFGGPRLSGDPVPVRPAGWQCSSAVALAVSPDPEFCAALHELCCSPCQAAGAPLGAASLLAGLCL